MIASTRKLIVAIFGKNSLDEVSVSELQQLVEQYPSFQAGHYLLSKKLQLEGSEEFLQETQRTALYFNNPFWLQWLLQHSAFGSQPAIASADNLPAIESPLFSIEQFPQPRVNSWPSAQEPMVIEETSSRPLPAEPKTTDQFERAQDESVVLSQSEAERALESSDAEIVDEMIAAHVESSQEVSNEQPELVETNGPWSDADVESELVSEIAQVEAAPLEQPQDSWPSSSSATDDLRESTLAPETSLEPLPPPVEQTSPRMHYFWETEQNLEASSASSQDQSMQPAIPSESVNRSEPWFADASGKGKYFWQTQPEVPTEPQALQPEYAAIPEAETSQSLLPMEVPPPQQEAKEAPLEPVAQVASKTEHLEPHNPSDQETAEFVTQAPQPEPAPVPEAEVTQPLLPLEVPSPALEETDKEFPLGHVDQIPIVTEYVEPSRAPDKPSAEPDREAPDLAEPTAAPIPKLQHIQTEPLLIEPYHTIDYFASQGIRFVAEENPTDRFGKQLKSFTDWLKVMKKLPVARPSVDPEEVDDSGIQMIASYSNEEKDIVTETMAEVLAKQGKTDRAIELYHKLSLLIPAKSAYFAAKIDNLKNALT